MAGLSRLGLATVPMQALRRLGVLGQVGCRAYGSAAAAVQYDYDGEDYFSEEEEQAQMHRNIPQMESAAGSALERGVQWVLIGEPGAKKHVYAERLAKLLEVPHISMGTLLRQELNPRSSLYKQIANAVDEGKLVPEDVIFALLSKRLEEGYSRGENGFILDGIPRTRIQAEILDQIADIDLVVNFKCSEEPLVKTNMGCETFSAGQEFLSMGNSGSSTVDVRGAWKEKIRIYAEQGKLLEDYYRKQQKLLNFQLTGAPGETWQGLLAALHLKHMHAVCSSQKLTA